MHIFTYSVSIDSPFQTRTAHFIVQQHNGHDSKLITFCAKFKQPCTFTDKDGKISWEEFKKAHFSSDGRDEDNAEQMKEDEQRFKHADIDGDGKLDFKEYTSFYHPGVSTAQFRHGVKTYTVISRQLN